MRDYWTRIIGWIRPLPEKVLHDELRRQQYEALKSKSLTMYSVVLIQLGAWMLAGVGHLPPLISIYAPAAMMMVISTRMVIWRRRRNDIADAESIKRRIRTTIAVAWGISFMLGAYGVAVLMLAAPTQFAFALLLICLASIAGAYCLAVLPYAAIPTVTVGALPSGLLLLFSGERLLIAMGLDLVLTCLIILGMVFVQYREFVGNIVAQAYEKRLAQSDALTGLPNRRAFMDHLQDIAASAGREKSFALLMIDLNGFKPVNDNYGHGLGDQLLVQIAHRLKRLGPGQAFAARLGGDEFAIIVPGVACAADAQDYAERVLGIFAKPFVVGGVTVSLSAAVGIALYPEHANDELSLIANADLALYRGKRGGGSPIVLYDKEIKEQTRRAMHLEQAMGFMDGIAEVDVAYQPIVELGTGEILRFEALARWTDSALGAVNPVEFIGAAERTGKVSRMSERIFDTALLTASSWPPHVGLSINMSAVQLHNPSVPLMLAKLLDFYRFDPARLEIEFAEAVFLKDIETAKRTIGLLREIGVRIVLDNFGAGYASVGYLKEMHFDHVKLDGRLMRDIDGSPPAQLLVAGLLQLCGAMGIQCTAEQIERQSQRDVLERLECGRGQGYLFGRPMSVEAVSQIIRPPDLTRQFSALLAFGGSKKAV